MGGLGLRLTSNFNKALLSKLGWSLLKIDLGLWKNVLSLKYLKSESWLDVRIKQSDSKFWKGLAKQKEFLATSYCHQINIGKTTYVCKNPRIPSLPYRLPIHSSNDIFKDPALRVSELILEEPRRWNTSLLQALFSYPMVREISKIPLR